MKKHRTWVILSMLLVMLIVEITVFSSPIKAGITSESIVKVYTGSVNGVERSLIVTKRSTGIFRLYFQIEEEEPALLFADFLDAGIDRYGSVWFIDPLERGIYWWNYDLAPPDYKWFDSMPDWNDPEGRVHDIESFVFEGSGSQAIVVGYKTALGEIKPLMTFDEMKAILEPDSTVPEPLYVPKENVMLDTQPVETPSESPALPLPTLDPGEESEPPASNPPVTPSPSVTPVSSATSSAPVQNIQVEAKEKVSKQDEKSTPAKVTGLKLKAKKKAIEASWKKASGATGYEIQVGTSKKFKKKSTKTTKKTKLTINKLKPKTKYFVRVRAYHVANGKKTYGKWSKVTNIKTKK